MDEFCKTCEYAKAYLTAESNPLRRDQFTLPEGTCVLQYPHRISRLSFDDFEHWMELELHKLKRCITEDTEE